MKILAQALFLLAFLPLAQAAGRTKVLFTTFDPFGGSPANNTQPIGALLAAHPEWIGPGVEVAVCNLPVVYGAAPEEALRCIERESPSLVISLGEAYCQLRVESAANNLDDTPGFPDNAGNIHVGQPILPGAPARLGLAFPVESMICAIDPTGTAGVDSSVTPGNFVCNNIAFSLTAALPAKGIPFTFLHVPNSRCRNDLKDPEKNARLIARAAAAGMAALASPSDTNTLWRPQGRMPSSLAEVKTLLGWLATGNAPACERSFAERLREAYLR